MEEVEQRHAALQQVCEDLQKDMAAQRVALNEEQVWVAFIDGY